MVNLDLKNKKVVLMGLGLLGGGLGTAKFLAEKGADLLITDLKSRKELKFSVSQLRKYKNIKFVLGEHRKKDFQSADLVIKNPAVSNKSPYLETACKNKIPTETDISLFFLLNRGTVIGITGSKGKSTTASWLYDMFKRAKRKVVLAGNIRVSPLAKLKQINKETTVILELSSWQLNSLKKEKASPYISLITNIYREHLNKYPSYQQYIADKKIIFQNQTISDFAILNKDNPVCRNLGKEVVSQRYWFSQKNLKEQNGCFIKNKNIYFRQQGKEEKIIDSSQIALPGHHNLENALGAVAAARIFGLPKKSVQQSLQKFKGIDNRLQLVRTWRKIKFFNDTTATHPKATIAALNSFSQKVILIAGGADKQLNFSELARKIKNKTKFLVIFPGTASEKLLKELKKQKFQKIAFAQSMAEAIKVVRFLAVAEDIVLLSPGAASFNMFNNEFDRGSQFNQCVTDLN